METETTPYAQMDNVSTSSMKSVAPQPDRGGVAQEMDRLAAQVEKMEKVVELLHNRIEPVMRDSVANAKDYDEPMGGSALSRWIGLNNMRLEILLDRLQHMADRVDL